MTDGSGGITPVGGLGMLWYPVKAYGDFRVKLQFREGRTDGGFSNGGVFVRFPNPEQTPRTDECAKTASAATDDAWVAIYCGHEIQLYDGETGETRKTGSIYTFDNNDIDKIGDAEAARRVGGLRDRGRRPALHDQPQRRGDQRVREHAGQGLGPRAATRARRCGSSRRATSACRTTAARTRCSTATSASRTCRRARRRPRTATGPFTVSGTGPHTIEVRSTDAAGNVEAKQTFDVRDRRATPRRSDGRPSRRSCR